MALVVDTSFLNECTLYFISLSLPLHARFFGGFFTSKGRTVSLWLISPARLSICSFPFFQTVTRFPDSVSCYTQRYLLPFFFQRKKTPVLKDRVIKETFAPVPAALCFPQKPPVVLRSGAPSPPLCIRSIAFFRNDHFDFFSVSPRNIHTPECTKHTCFHLVLIFAYGRCSGSAFIHSLATTPWFRQHCDKHCLSPLNCPAHWPQIFSQYLVGVLNSPF